jgi:translation initiation factor IF-2
MAKIRVYELARDLNMKNKVLLEKLNEMDIHVGTHMSTLDDETVANIKARLMGSSKNVIEETRIRPTVIRRRRKAVRSEQAPVEPEAEATPSETADADAAPETSEQAAVSKEAPAAEAAATPAVKVVQPEAEPAAVIVKKAPQPEPDPEPAETPLADASAEAGATTAKSAESPQAEPGETVAETAAQDGVADAAPDAAASQDESPQPAEPAAKEPLKRKVKKDAPAKIIKMGPPPAQGVKPSPTRTGPGRSERPASRPAPAQDLAGDRAKGKGARRKTDGPAARDNRKFSKKKISFRRKAVVEGAALYGDSPRHRKSRKGPKGKTTGGQKTQITQAKAIKRRIKIDDAIVLAELAKRMGIKASEIIKNLMGMGVMATVNQTIDFETAGIVAAEFGYELEKASFEEEAILKIDQTDDPGILSERPPVVTVMGHVDHGKTSLLDVIRKTRVTEGEAGGITQHIGAYYVETAKGRVVFLDTPGHEAFTSMRSRGAQVTDLVILVVAADDGVMPQTIEAINHARAAEVPIIVAINKIDKANADQDRVIRELAENGLAPEEWGGDTIFVRVSAKTKEGIDDLLEMVLLQSEMLELKANADKLAIGHVIEAKLDQGRGPVATVLVKEGTLRAGDPVVCGMHYGKLRALRDDLGQMVSEAGPSIPVEVIGLSGVPSAGDELVALEDEKSAKQVSNHRTQKQRSVELARTNRLSLDNLFEQMQVGEVKDLNLIIKADVHGSIEALKDSLVKLSNDEVKINVVHAATGTIIESDVPLATVSNAIIIGFNVRPNAKVQAMANEEGVDMRYYSVIYDVINDVKNAIVGMMASTFKEQVLGRADVRQVFHVPKVGAIAGCYVTDGKIQRNQRVRLLRDGIVTYEGKINSLRRYKDDVKEVLTGFECGIGIENYNDIKEGDVLECFFLEEVKPEVA